MIEINLLPKEYKKRGNVLSFDKKIMYAGAAAALVVLAVGVVTLWQRHQISRLDNLMAKAKVEENRYKKDIAVIDALTEVKDKILARVGAIEKLDHRRTFYISMLEDLNARIPEYLWMTGFKETPPAGVAAAPATQPGKAQPGGKQPPPPPPTTPTNGPQIGSCEIEGYAYSLNAIGSLIINLSKSDFFNNVKLGRAAAEEVGSVSAYNFRLTCDLNYDAHLQGDNTDESGEDINLSSVHDSDAEMESDYAPESLQ